MTHDELLAKLAPAYIGKWDWNTRTNALRAVVELHKPSITLVNRTTGATRQKCRCQADYPCETIQAIEKRLL